MKNFLCKWFTMGYICLYLLIGMLVTFVPVQWIEVGDTRTTEETFPHGSMKIDTTISGEYGANMFGGRIDHDDIIYTHVLNITCVEETTVIFGHHGYRSPDKISASYFCAPNDPPLIIQLTGFSTWITFASKGTTSKHGLYSTKFIPE